MLSNSKNFVQLCLEGKAILSEIDEYVQKWHNSDSDIPLYEYLGMTPEEYALWVEKDNALRIIIASRKQNIDFRNIQKSKHLLAARAANADEFDEVIEWLKKTGRI